MSKEPKKKHAGGRPKGSKDFAIKPAKAAVQPLAPGEKRGRGRPPGAKNHPRAIKTKRLKTPESSIETENFSGNGFVPQKQINVGSLGDKIEQEYRIIEEELKGFDGNALLKPAGEKFAPTPEQTEEITKCMMDPAYFIENYIKIVTQDEGVVPFKLRRYQRKLLRAYHENLRVVSKCSRQSGKTTLTAAYLLWTVNFQEYKTCAVLANKLETAQETIDRIKFSYMHLPRWMQAGVKVFNERSMTLENGSKVFCAGTTAAAISGKSISILYVDEVDLIPPKMWSKFYASVYPTVSAGKTTKIIFTSTPKGYLQLFRIWQDAVAKQSSFVPVSIKWDEVPGRDEKFKERTIRDLMSEGDGERLWRQEYECLSEDVRVTIRNNKTGIVSSVTMGELYELSQK